MMTLSSPLKTGHTPRNDDGRGHTSHYHRHNVLEARGSARPKGGIPPFSSKLILFVFAFFHFTSFSYKRSYESKQKDSLIIAIFPLYVP